MAELTWYIVIEKRLEGKILLKDIVEITIIFSHEKFKLKNLIFE